MDDEEFVEEQISVLKAGEDDCEQQTIAVLAIARQVASDGNDIEIEEIPSEVSISNEIFAEYASGIVAARNDSNGRSITVHVVNTPEGEAAVVEEEMRLSHKYVQTVDSALDEVRGWLSEGWVLGADDKNWLSSL